MAYRTSTRPRRSNRGAIRTLYGGVTYASKSEAHYAMYLNALVRAKKIASWQGQVRVPLVVKGKKVCVMVPDFLVTHNDGRLEYREVKGNPERVWVLKLKLFRALFPEAWYTVIKAREALSAIVL